jgi:hypothetical protein
MNDRSLKIFSQLTVVEDPDFEGWELTLVSGLQA